MTRALLGLLLLAVLPAHGHPLAPALLELRETAPERYAVLWRTSVTRRPGVDVAPQLPAGCREVAAPVAGLEDEALVARWTVECPGGLVGRRVAVTDLDRGGITAILRVQDREVGTATLLLDGARSAAVIERAAGPGAVILRYLGHGIAHLVLGLDHLLFVAGLVLLVRRGRALVLTVTAFTLGHSVTLGLATLGWITVDAALMELGIALSILVLACALARGAAPLELARRPALMAAVFGLLHGLGFAGALTELGLPRDDVTNALLGFNLGIEAGQLAVVALMLGAGWLWVRVAPVARPALATYAIGSLAAFWCFERALVLLA